MFLGVHKVCTNSSTSGVAHLADFQIRCAALVEHLVDPQNISSMQSMNILWQLQQSSCLLQARGCGGGQQQPVLQLLQLHWPEQPCA